MANNREEAGKGTPRPGEMPASRRPYATIDVRATEIEGPDAPVGMGAAKPAATPPNPPSHPSRTRPPTLSARRPAPGLQARWHCLARVAAPSASPPTWRPAPSARSSFSALRSSCRAIEPAPARAPEVGDLTRRLADVESVLGTRPNTGLRSRVEEMGRSLGALGDAQAKLARDTKALESQVRRRPGDAARADGAAHQARGDAGGHVRQPIPPARRPSWRRSPAGSPSCKTRSAKPARRHGRASPVSTASCPPSAPRRAGSPSASMASGARSRSGSKAPPRPPTWRPLTAKLAALERDLQTFNASEADRSAQCLAHRADAGARQPQARHRSRRALCRRAGAGEEGRRLAQLHGAGALQAGGRADARRARQIVPPRRPTPCSTRRPSAPMPALVDRLLAGARSHRARAQGRPRRRRHQRRGGRRPHGGGPEGRPARRGAGQRQDAAAQGRTGRRGLGQEGRGAPGRRAGAGRGRGGAQVLARRRLRPAPRTGGDDPHPSLSASRCWRSPPASTGWPTARAPSSSTGRATSPRPACSAPSSCCCC